MEKSHKLILLLISIVFITSCKNRLEVVETGSLTPMPEQWIDKDTHHKVIRLTDPGLNSRSFYFHNDPFLKLDKSNHDYMVYYGNVPQNTDDKDFTPRNGRQIYLMDLKTRESVQITDHPGFLSGEIVGKKGKRVYYQVMDSVFSTHLETRETELVFVFPENLRGSITTLNADETLLGGVYSDVEKQNILAQFPRKGDFFERIYNAKIRHTLITVNIEDGTMTEIFSDTAWINHVQFSPADPEQLMFCHEGPWHKVDRIWTINIEEKKPMLMHRRTMNREIAGHEFFSVDGKTIWFDLQMPRGETFFLAGVDIETGEEIRYAMKRDEWSIHFNISPDQKTFAGDGGDEGQVAKAKDGMWLYHFFPEGDNLRSEKLVNMKHHDYDLEPNVHFSPDGKWIIFRANFEGSSQVYAVEI